MKNDLQLRGSYESSPPSNARGASVLLSPPLCVCVHMCVCVCGCVSERQCVNGRATHSTSLTVSSPVCVCVCVRERERESVCVCVSESVWECSL